MVKVDFTVDDDGLINQLHLITDRVGNYRPVLKRFQNEMRTITIQHFNALAQGGDNRGVHWDYFKNPRYVRKTDGAAVPPWGGVPYARIAKTKSGRPRAKQPIVKGMLRPSGARLKKGDAILQDTRRLLRSVSSQIDYEVSDNVSLTWGTRLKYAEKQHKRRPFLFFTPDDVKNLESMIAKYLEAVDGNTG